MNTQSAETSRIGADEFITVLDFSTGVQYKQVVGENRNIFARVAFVSQTWIGGGTAVSAQGDFGLRGVTFGIGYNR